MKAWGILAWSICLEVTGSMCIKFSDGFSKTLPTLSVFILYGLSFWGLSVALKDIEIGTAYAVWAGSGTALVAILGILFFGDKATALKLASLGLIIAGVIGLNLAGGHS